MTASSSTIACSTRSSRPQSSSVRLLGLTRDGLPPVRIDLAAEHLIEHNVDIYLDVPRTRSRGETAPVRDKSVQSIDRLVKLIFGAVLRGHCAALLVGAEIENN